MINLKEVHIFPAIFFFLLIFGAPKGLAALDSLSINEALRKPIIEKRLNMTIGVLGNSKGLTF